MQSAYASRPSPGVGSIGRRFSYALIGVVTLVLIAFAVIGVFFNITIMERELETRLGNAMKLAQKSLPTPLWNLDSNVVNDFVEALFLDESIVYTKISWEEQVVTEKRRPGFLLQQIESGMPSRLLSGSEFIVKSSDIYFGENKVGKILSVMSRKSVRTGSFADLRHHRIDALYHCGDLGHMRNHNKKVYISPFIEITRVGFIDRSG